MKTIENAAIVACEFLKEMLKVSEDEIRVIKTIRTDSEWEAECEVYEESSFIKTLGLPTRVKDRNIYRVELDEKLDIKSYERKGHKAEGE